jgi:hypothetical protein
MQEQADGSGSVGRSESEAITKAGIPPTPSDGSTRGALSPGSIRILLCSLGAWDGVAHGAGGVLAVLAWRSDAAGRCWSRIDTLAKRTGFSERTTWRAIGDVYTERRPSGERIIIGLSAAELLTFKWERPRLDFTLADRGHDRGDGLAAQTANRILDQAAQLTLPHGSGAVLAVLLALCDGAGRCEPIIDVLAEWTGISRRGTLCACAALDAAGIIERRRGRRASTYRIVGLKRPRTRPASRSAARHATYAVH